jgi:peptidyl-prolyl cis-trans isomerase SurA
VFWIEVMRALTYALLVLAGLFGVPSVGGIAQEAAPQQRIAAVVNDRVVSLRDLTDRLELVMLTSGIPDSQQARARLAPQVLRSLIEETLQLQEAERLNITVNDQDIDRALGAIAERNNMSVDDLRRFLSDNGVNFATLLDQLRAQIAWVKVVNRQIRPQVNVTVDQLDLAVQEARQSQGQPEYLLSEIVLPIDSPDQAETVANDAVRLVQTLREGANFDSLARQVSAAASAERGGDLGWVRASVIPPELLSALEQLRPGEVSAPLRSPIGYHIFWLRDQRLSNTSVNNAAGDVQVSLTQILFPVNGSADASHLAALREQAANLRDRLETCDDMVKVAEQLAAPASGELGWLRVADLPADLAQAVLDLPVGQVSQPLEGPAGIHLLMVCDRRDPEGLATDRDQIAQDLEQERLDRLARRYLRDLRKAAFVEVRL